MSDLVWMAVRWKLWTKLWKLQG